MKRKLAVLLSVLLCAFGLTACSSSSASDTASEDMAVYKTEAVALIDTLVNEQKTLDELKAEANDEDEAAAFEAGFSAWEDAKEELGAVSEIKEDSADVSYENQNKLYVVSVDGTFDKRDAVVTVTFDKKGNLSSVAFNGVYTLGEKMSKAALNTVMGLAVVFIMLIFISLINSTASSLSNEAEERAAAKKKASEPAPAPAPAPVVEETVEEEDDLELVAVIAAAIAASEGTDPNGLVVRSIKRVGKTNNWKRA